MLLISRLIFEKEKLSSAIANAKANRTFNIDVAVETNKFRQAAASAIRNMLRFKPNTKKTKGVDYKFDVNGTQVPYRYDVEIVSTDAFNRDYAKQMFNRLMTVSDTISSAVDDVVVNDRVEYEPPFDVNSNFEDAVALLPTGRAGSSLSNQEAIRPPLLGKGIGWGLDLQNLTLNKHSALLYKYTTMV